MASLLSPNFGSELNLLPFHQVFIYGTHVLSQLQKFWADIQVKLGKRQLYIASISKMKLKLSKMQKSDLETQKIRLEDLQEYKKADAMLYY